MGRTTEGMTEGPLSDPASLYPRARMRWTCFSAIGLPTRLSRRCFFNSATMPRKLTLGTYAKLGYGDQTQALQALPRIKVG